MVAVPLVAPAPVMTQVVDVATPQASAVAVTAAGVVPPIAPGEAKVAPPSCEAFKFGTTVVLVTVSGAVPIATVDTSAGAERLFEETTAFVVVPATAGAVKVALPLVEPAKLTTPLVAPTSPTVRDFAFSAR